MAELKIGRLMMGIAQTNCYFIYREDDVSENDDGDIDNSDIGSNTNDKDVIFIDPADRGDYIHKMLEENGFHVAGILLTHGHFDHIWGADKLRELSGAKIYACEEEREVCENARMNVSESAGRACTVSVDEYLKDGEEVTIAGITCRLIATPGHTKGSCCYYFEEDKILISGDTLFQESVGRSDLPTGSMSTLVRSIREKLFVLPEDVKVYPGHGDTTDIGYEKVNNPFC